MRAACAVADEILTKANSDAEALNEFRKQQAASDVSMRAATEEWTEFKSHLGKASF